MTTTPSDLEQLMLELINQARMDPDGEYARMISNGEGITTDIENALTFFGVDLTALESQFDAMEAVAPVAWNGDLADAAEGHSELLIQNDSQSHQEPGELSLGDRVEAEGYDFQTVSENVYSYAEDVFYGHAGFMIDWGYDDIDITNGVVNDDFAQTGDGIQDAAGHRVNIMSDSVTEVGISVIAETDPETDVGPFVITQNFGTRSDSPVYLLGVVIEDRDDDDFYDIGEGISGATITATRQGTNTQVTTTSWASGGYQVELTAGIWLVSIDGTDFAEPVTQTVFVGSENVKLDAHVTIDDTPDPITGTDDADSLTGTDSDDTIAGQDGDDTIAGQDGDDSLAGDDGSDWITPGTGDDTVDGGDGVDMVSFSDLGEPVVIDLIDGTAISGGDTDTLIFIEGVTGTIYADTVTGDDGDNRIRTLGHYDWIYGSDGADTIDGGSGRDMISYSGSAAAVVVDFLLGYGQGGQAEGDEYTRVERATGSSLADQFIGSAASEEFRGLGGYDWFVGTSEGAADRYNGGSGRDTVAYSNATMGVHASLTTNQGTFDGGKVDQFTSIENLTGTDFDDTLIGDDGRNVLRGMFGNDTLQGEGGKDRLYGGKRDDLIDGGSGFDIALYDLNRADYSVDDQGDVVTVTALSGREGTDTLTGIEMLQFADDTLAV